MPRITYVEDDGTRHVAEVAVGLSVMEGAVRNGFPGILAECGGACACATCQVYVPEAWRAVTGVASEVEADMLEFAEHVRPESRLSCQITVTEAMDGLVVHMPASQG